MTDHQLPKTLHGEPRAFFGRRSGKKLHGGQKAIVDEALPELEIALAEHLDPKTLFPQAKRLVIEIGYGALKLLVTLPDASIDAVYLLYPDPWPKTRHHKRRFVSPTTLKELARVIRPGGTFHFATDIEDYADWTLAHIVREPEFIFAPEAPGAWHTPYPGWQPTRYEQKARREGRMISFYFSFTRR
jgi:tRNA (guanine-N7-)-methyltransferase